jgi:hypothetical protein
VFAQKSGKLIFFGMLLGPEGAVASSLGPKKFKKRTLCSHTGIYLNLKWDKT